jgi:methylisocitrate lyase
MIFPEAMASSDEFKQFRDAINAPLLANMTEFGKSPLLSADQLQSIGYNIVIYPVTTLRLAMKAVEDGLKQIRHEGTQANLIDRMQTRARLYELLQYERYNQFDQSIYNFKVAP